MRSLSLLFLLICCLVLFIHPLWQQHSSNRRLSECSSFVIGQIQDETTVFMKNVTQLPMPLLPKEGILDSAPLGYDDLAVFIGYLDFEPTRDEIDGFKYNSSRPLRYFVGIISMIDGAISRMKFLGSTDEQSVRDAKVQVNDDLIYVTVGSSCNGDEACLFYYENDMKLEIPAKTRAIFIGVMDSQLELQRHFHFFGPSLMVNDFFVHEQDVIIASQFFCNTTVSLDITIESYADSKSYTVSRKCLRTGRGFLLIGFSSAISGNSNVRFRFYRISEAPEGLLYASSTPLVMGHDHSSGAPKLYVALSGNNISLVVDGSHDYDPGFATCSSADRMSWIEALNLHFDSSSSEFVQTFCGAIHTPTSMTLVHDSLYVAGEFQDTVPFVSNPFRTYQRAVFVSRLSTTTWEVEDHWVIDAKYKQSSPSMTIMTSRPGVDGAFVSFKLEKVDTSRTLWLYYNEDPLTGTLPVSDYEETWIVSLVPDIGIPYLRKLQGGPNSVVRDLFQFDNSLIVSGSYHKKDEGIVGAFAARWAFDPICPGNCSNQGTCIFDGTCECDSGYGGVNCSIYVCNGVLADNSSVCSGNGTCDGPNECTCYIGYKSSNCDAMADIVSITEVSGSKAPINCFVPTFQAEFLISFEAGSVTLNFLQGGDTFTNTTAVFGGKSITFTVPNEKIRNGSYSVEFSVTLTNGTRSTTRTKNITGAANCKLCDYRDASATNCRYQVAFDYVDVGVTKSITRMKPFKVSLMQRDLANTTASSVLPIAWYEWISNIDPIDTGINGYNKSDVFIISPVNQFDGMQGNTSLLITFQFEIRGMGVQNLSLPIYILPSEPIPPPETPLTIDPMIGESLIDKFSMKAGNWSNNADRLIYTFSYLDIYTNEYVRLGESTSTSLTSVLPPGDAVSRQLPIRLTVFNPENGNSGSAELNVTVTPKFVSGLLTQKLEESISSGNYTTTLVIASQIRGATATDVTTNLDELKKIASDILTYTQTQLIPDSVAVEQQLLVVDMITKNSVLVSNQGKQTALDIALDIIDMDLRNTSMPFVSKGGYQNVANILSNVAQSGFTDRTVAEKVIQTGNELSNLIANEMLTGAPARSVTSQNFKLTVITDHVSRLVNKTIGSSSGQGIDSLSIPSRFLDDIEEQVVTTSILVFNENPYHIQSDSKKKDTSVTSPIIDIKFKNGSSVLPVTNLTQPLMIYFDRTKARQQNACPEATFKCQYWSELDEKWKSDGCFWVQSTNLDHISCACNHTTSFSAFVLEKGDSCVKYQGVKITGIVFNSMYFIICVPVLIGLFVLSRQQPLRSRFIAPYLGITAIMVDSLIQGLIRNILSLAAEQDASDAFSYIIILTANPLFVTALFVFLWQQIRFLFLQNIYHFMPSANSKLRNSFIRWNRLMASKSLFLVVSVGVGLAVMSYFAILVGLAAHYNDTQEIAARNKLVTVQAISFAAMLIFVAIGMLATMIIDIGYSIKQESESKRMLRMENETEQFHVKKTKGIGWLAKHFTNDPLLFRTEAVIIFVVLIVLLILYPIGIATVVQEPKQKAPIMIVRTIIEILFMFGRIFAFGGFVLLASLKGWVQSRGMQPQYEELASSSSSNLSKEGLSDKKVLDILRDPLGYQIVFDFCRKEFSLENLLLWKELESIRSRNLLMTPEERKKVLKEIKELYIDNNSARQLNISNQQRRVFLKVCKAEEPSVSDSEEAFANLFGVCLTNITDTLTRLSSTEAFKSYELSRTTCNELNDDFS